MTDPESPIIDFYPENFVEDMNGKKQEWEAVVKIPFIDETRLLKAMAARDNRLSVEEKSRNQTGQLSTQFIFDEETATLFNSSLPGVFPDLAKCRCRMEPFELPILHEGMEFRNGLLDGVHLGASALAGFPSTKTLPHHAQLAYHGVNVHGQDSRNPSMVVTIENAYEDAVTQDLAKNMVGQRTFLYWPFLQEGLVVAVSDEHFKYEKQSRGQVVATPHDPGFTFAWRKKADRIEGYYSKRFAVITGNVDVLLHVRPLRGLKRLDTGALVKDYEDADKETEQAVQMSVQHVAFEDERFLEQSAPPLHIEYPKGSKVIFLGDQAYGVAAQVTDVKETSLSINLAFFPNEQRENFEYQRVVKTRPTEQYFPSFVLARQLRVSPLALSRIASSLLVEMRDGPKSNIGLSLKFESKGQKVLGYTRKSDRGWEYSRMAFELVEKYIQKFPEVFQVLDGHDRGITKARDIFPGAEDADAKVKEIRSWLKSEGVLDLQPVSLFEEQLETATVHALEELADDFNSQRSRDHIKRMLIHGIPRQAVLKPAHAEYRLTGQMFALGDRVVMVQDSAVGGVALSMRGVVIGLNTTTIDVVWDTPFIGGGSLGGRCSEHRGSVAPFSSCLNLTRPQFAVSTAAQPKVVGQNPAFKPRIGPAPVVPGHNFRPANQTQHILNRPVQPVQAQRGPPAKLHQPGQGQYGNAAKGVKPAVQANGHRQPQVPHTQMLAMSLNNGAPAQPRAAAPDGANKVRGNANGQALLQHLQNPPAPPLAVKGTNGAQGNANGQALLQHLQTRPAPPAVPAMNNGGMFDGPSAPAQAPVHPHQQHQPQQHAIRGGHHFIPRGRGAHRGRGGHPPSRGGARGGARVNGPVPAVVQPAE